MRELLELGGKLEGLTRNVGMHAGGVLIAPGKLTDFCPLYAAEGTANVVVAARQGRRRGGRPGQVRLPRPHHAHHPRLGRALRAPRSAMTDFVARSNFRSTTRQAYQLLSAGNTTAVFQLESRGMRDLLKRARPDRFEDMIALVALYRPGPMDLIPDFIERKHGKRVEYLDPRLEPILGPTYGIMVYQEQVMQIAQVIGGYTLGGADLLRRAMGKKKPEEMAAAARDLRRRRARNGARARQGDAALRPDGEVRRLRLQQVARRRLRAARVPDRVHEGAPRGRVHGREPVRGDGRHRQGAPVPRGRASRTASRSLPPDINASEYRFVPVDAKHAPLRPGRGEGHRRGAIERHRRGARRGAVHRPVRLLQPRRQAHASTGA